VASAAGLFLFDSDCMKTGNTASTDSPHTWHNLHREIHHFTSFPIMANPPKGGDAKLWVCTVGNSVVEVATYKLVRHPQSPG
jgi:hypothetical protein